MQKINITFFMMTIFCSFNLSSGSCWLWIPRKDRRTCFTKRCVLIFFKISPLRAFTLSKIFSLDRGEFFFVAKQFFSTYTCTHVPLKMALNQWCNFENNLWLACRKQCVCHYSLFYFFQIIQKALEENMEYKQTELTRSIYWTFFF